MMKFSILVLISVVASSAWAMKLEYVGETSFAHKTKFEKTTIGGISGIIFNKGTLYGLSDDKGRINDVRFYEFDLKIDKKAVTLTPKAVRFITDLPLKADGKKPSLDLEGLVRLPDGTFLMSSEGNNDAKPREMPRIFQTSATGKWMADLPIPDRYLPELTGKQTKGIQNNAAFEGLTSTNDGKTVFTSIEAALQPEVVANEEDKGDWIRIMKYSKGDAGFKVAGEYAYHIDAFSSQTMPKEVFRGVSEILAVSDTKLLVMERGVRIDPKNVWTQTIGIYLVDLSKATDISGTDKMDRAKITAATKTKIIDFEADLIKERAGKVVDNFECLAWGPVLPDGRKTLLVMSDDNFSKTQITELLVFAVEGE
jgi:3-phytase